MARPIRPTRSAVWAARCFAALNGRVRAVNRHYVRGHWRVSVRQRWHHWEMWYPGDADGLARAERQRHIAEALR